MRWWTWLTLALMACGGDGGGSDTTDNGGTDGGGDDDDVTMDCDLLPEYNVDELDCDALWTAFLDVASAASACNSDHDCQIVQPDCVNWTQSVCFTAANDCLDQDIVNEYSDAGAGCHTATQDGCTCGSLPDVACKDHVCCIVGDTCGY